MKSQKITQKILDNSDKLFLNTEGEGIHGDQ